MPKVFGELDLENTSAETVTITKAVLAHPRGLRILGARAVPFTNDSRVVAEGWPPTDPDVRSLWRRQGVDVAGLELSPGEKVTVWAGVQAPRDEGTADAIRIVYSQGGSRSFQDGVEQLRVVAGRSC